MLSKSLIEQALVGFSDGELLGELSRRGRLKDVCSQAALGYRELGLLKDGTGYFNYVKSSLAVRLGKHLLDNGFVEVEEHDDDEFYPCKYIRMSVLAVTFPQPSAG